MFLPDAPIPTPPPTILAGLVGDRLGLGWGGGGYLAPALLGDSLGRLSGSHLVEPRLGQERIREAPLSLPPPPTLVEVDRDFHGALHDTACGKHMCAGKRKRHELQEEASQKRADV